MARRLPRECRLESGKPKRRWDTRAEAKEAARRQDYPCHAYLCRHCGYFHIATTKENDAAAAVRGGEGPHRGDGVATGPVPGGRRARGVTTESAAPATGTGVRPAAAGSEPHRPRPVLNSKVLSVSDKGRVYEVTLTRFELARIGRDEARRVAA